MTKVLLVGNGAREHAIAAALHRDGIELVVRADKHNPGIARLSKHMSIGPLDGFGSYPELTGVDYAIIGPEAPLAAGVVDFLEQQGIPCVGPHQEAASIETSKIFARHLLAQTYPRANPDFGVARNLNEVERFVEKIGLENTVVKPDGLTGGKGVKLFGEHLHSHEEVLQYAGKLIAKEGAVLIEKRLSGIEFTVQAFVDGKRIITMPLVRDYKRAFDGDKGPNTGSMGSYSQENHGLDYVDKRDLYEAHNIMKAAIHGIKEQTGYEYKGILYGQFMKTDSGICVVEFNARFGDPEAMNVLTILDDSMDTICQRVIDGNLRNVMFEAIATVCVYVVPEGYPGPEVIRDAEIRIEKECESVLYYASVYEKQGKIFTTGSRAIGILATGETVQEAREKAYRDVKKISGRIRYRTDIAKDVGR